MVDPGSQRRSERTLMTHSIMQILFWVSTADNPTKSFFFANTDAEVTLDEHFAEDEKYSLGTWALKLYIRIWNHSICVKCIINLFVVYFCSWVILDCIVSHPLLHRTKNQNENCIWCSRAADVHKLFIISDQ